MMVSTPKKTLFAVFVIYTSIRREDLDLLFWAQKIDQLAFVVALRKRDIDTKSLGFVLTKNFDICQCRWAVNLGLAGAKQVQIRPVQDQD